MKISLSSEWSCKDEYSAVHYAVKAARLDIEKYLNEKASKYYPQLLEDVWKKYDDRKKRVKRNYFQDYRKDRANKQKVKS